MVSLARSEDAVPYMGGILGVFAMIAKRITVWRIRTPPAISCAANGTVLARVQVRKSGGSYQVRAGALSNGSYTYSSWYAISNASRPIELAWRAATTTSGTNGSLSLYVDNAKKQTLAGLRNGSCRLEDARLGAIDGLSGVTGTAYYDAFASTRSTLIGP
jgi:hypothetical protein